MQPTLGLRSRLPGEAIPRTETSGPILANEANAEAKIAARVETKVRQPGDSASIVTKKPSEETVATERGERPQRRPQEPTTADARFTTTASRHPKAGSKSAAGPLPLRLMPGRELRIDEKCGEDRHCASLFAAAQRFRKAPHGINCFARTRKAGNYKSGQWKLAAVI
jgi:hypothetical protein